MPKIKTTDPIREHNRHALEAMPEVCVFMAAYYGVCEIRKLAQFQQARGTRKGEITFTGENELALIQTFRDTVAVTYRFGILWPIMTDSEGGRDYSPFFWRWFNWWMDWLIAGHSPKELDHLRRLADRRSPELEEWRPPGDWMRYRKDIAF